MTDDYFVMLHTQNGGITPMVSDNEEIATFKTFDEAAAVASENPLGEHFGFEVFCRGMGE